MGALAPVAACAIALVAILLLLPPGLDAVAPLSPALPPSGSALVIDRLAVHAAPGSTSTLPGADPASEAAVDAPRLALEQFGGAVPALRGLELPRSNLSMIPPAPSAPATTPAATSVGNVSGLVEDAISHRPIPLVGVTASPVNSGCQGVGCLGGLTNAFGIFDFGAPAGLDNLYFIGLNYSANSTRATVVAGSRTYVGTVYLVPDGFVEGRIVSSAPGHPALSNISVVGSSRNTAAVGSPAFDASNGSFYAAVPPVADRIDFTAPLGAAPVGNFTYADPSPGQVVQLGTIEMFTGTLLRIHLVDRVTHQPILSGLANSVLACMQRSGDCPYVYYNESAGPIAECYALPGPTVLHVLALGYVVNVTPIGPVPSEPLGTPYQLEVNLTPLGVVSVVPGVSGGMPSVGGNTSQGWWSDIAPGSSNITGAGVCSLDGLLVAMINPAVGLVPAPCFPSILATFGSTSLLLGPPLRDWVSTGDFLGVAPMFGNETWVNLTPDRVTAVGYLNFTPGAYVHGRIVGVDGAPAPLNFTVQACSTDVGGVCGGVMCYPWPGGAGANCRTADLDQANMSRVGCAITPEEFCVAAPPGAVRIDARDPKGGSTNSSWVEIPVGCCVRNPHALDLVNLSADPEGRSLGLGASNGSIFGRVLPAPGEDGPPMTSASISICPVAASALASQSCPPVDIGPNFPSFSLPARLGWDEVDVVAGGYIRNSTWIDVTGRNGSGTIFLDAMSEITGTVLGPGGGGVLGAIVEACPVSAGATPGLGCQSMGGQATGTSGLFTGQVEGGAFPGATYAIRASASGYLDNWTWVNATLGQVVGAPTISLTPVDGAPARPSRTASLATASPPSGPGNPGAWVVGRVVDASTGAGLSYSVSLSACDVTGWVCTAVGDGSSTGGYYNQSLPVGRYLLNVSANGYVPLSVYVNATSPSTVNLGRQALTPLPWVAGRVAIAPWTNWSLSNGLGPGPALVAVCRTSSGPCGLGGLLNTAGAFNVSAPLGSGEQLAILPVGGDPYDGDNDLQAQGSGAFGFLDWVRNLTVGPSGVVLASTPSTVPTLAIFASLSGIVWNGATVAGPSHRPTQPARWAELNSSALSVTGFTSADGFPGSGIGQSGLIDLSISGGGSFTIFAPGGATLYLLASGLAFRAVNNSTARLPMTGRSAAVAPFVLAHFGWVDGTVETAGGVRIPHPSVGSSEPDPRNGSGKLLTTSGSGAASGYFNLSAPPGASVSVSANASGYLGTSAKVSVVQNQTTHLGVLKLAQGALDLLVRTPQVNLVPGPPVVGLVDPVTGAPIDLASVSLFDGPTRNLEGGSFSNALGQFALSAPSAAGDFVTVTRPGYVSQSISVGTVSGSTYLLHGLNVTGDGILAGEVVVRPEGLLVANANVTACPTNGGACETQPSNGEGVFELELPPGGYTLNLTAAGYTTNESFGALVVTDSWQWIGNLTVFGDAIVSGSVVGAPYDRPLVGANVTICPVNGSFSVYCAFVTPTDPSGGFEMPLPSGVYELAVRAPGFGEFLLELELLPGSLEAIGTITLAADGSVTGRVVDASTGAPLLGASVIACPNGEAGACDGPATSGAGGLYYLADVAPGADYLVAADPGYQSETIALLVGSGDQIYAPTLSLWPDGQGPVYPVAGRVVWNASGAPIGAVTVAARPLNGGDGSSQVTGSSGDFLFVLGDGAFNLSASLAGARTGSLTIDVAGDAIGNLTIRLDPFTYLLRGSVVGAGSAGPLPGASVAAGPSVAVASGPSASFRLPLPNGSYKLTAQPPPDDLGEFVPLETSVAIDGSGRLLNLTLPEAGASLVVDALSSASGLAIAGASGSIVGTSRFGLPESVGFTTDSGGRFVTTLPDGNYTLSVAADGFAPASIAVALNGSARTVELRMAPTGLGSSSGSLSVPTLTALAFLGAATVTAAVLIAGRWSRRRPPPDDAPPAPPDDAPPPAD